MILIYHGMKDGKMQKSRRTLHSFIMNPDNVKGIQIDHINHDTLDNRRSNLRITTASENYVNRKGRNKNNKCGYRNVFWDSRIAKWSVRLCKNYKTIRVGDYDTIEEAAEAAESARIKYYGEYCGFN